MASTKVFVVPFRRKRKGKTNYKKRLHLLKSGKLRLAIRKSNKHLSAQVVRYGDKGDTILVSASSKELTKFGWKLSTNNLPAAYLVGLLIGQKAKGKEVILDLGLQTPAKGSRIYSLVKGAIDAGLKIKTTDDIFPSEDRISGKHISEDVVKAFEKTKQSIIK
jgi:large subunit ribosomal protein L18